MLQSPTRRTTMRSPVTLLLLTLSFIFSNGEEEATTATTEVSPESPWGRIYLRNGLAPIQYLRDDFGGPMTSREVSLYFPKRRKNRFGCELLPESESMEVEAANRSVVLVVDRGECTFEHKALLADQMGAAALLVVSPTDDVSAPVAALKNDEEISIASVMIRRTGGDMLRIAAEQMTIYGRFIPMTCERKPYTCKPRYADEEDYIESAIARSGVVLSVDKKGDDGTQVGTFLAATYGSVLPTKMPFLLAAPLDGIQACTDATKDSATHSEFEGKVVLIPAGLAGKCSEFEKVSNAQRRGANVVVLMQQDNATITTQPGVPRSLKDAHGDAARLRFAVSNGIADAWELLKQYSTRSSWPKRVKRCSKTLAQLLYQLRGFGGDIEVEEALKSMFLNVVSGSLQDWEKIAHPDQDADQDHETQKRSSSEKIVQTVEKSETRDEF
ncbi:PA clan of proteases domain-containing protein [Phytophthora infestans]|uniref:PA clan of proteases domain-containing protein n=1 Tax=Phytophthora infestans TaxID=4787 RepID=A0A833TIT5_PHYIN|nr:PA clan of proteases domain-containing protein [Phytophthora infestans]